MRCAYSPSCVQLFVTPWSPPGFSVHGDSPGKNPGVGCHALFQGIFPTQGSNPGLPHCLRILYPLSHQGSPSVGKPLLSSDTRIQADCTWSSISSTMVKPAHMEGSVAEEAQGFLTPYRPGGGTSLVVQQLRLCTPNAGGLGVIPGQGTRPHIPQLRARMQQRRFKILSAATKIKCGQIDT